MASIRPIQVGNRKGLKIELGGFKEARERFLKAAGAMDDESATTLKNQVALQFHAIAIKFADAVEDSAVSSNVAKRILKAIFAARGDRRSKVSVLAGVAKRTKAKYPSTKAGGLRLEWNDNTSKAGDSKGKALSMSLATAYDQGTKKTKATGFYTRVFNIQRPIMLEKMTKIYKDVIANV